MPAAIRERFFDKYATAGKSDGTGLGTYSAWLMARIQGGSLAMHTGDWQNKFSRTVPRFASESRLGVRTCGLPIKPSASARN